MKTPSNNLTFDLQVPARGEPPPVPALPPIVWARHAWLKDGQDEPLKLMRTSVACTRCTKGNMGVLVNLGARVKLHCERCDFDQDIPVEHALRLVPRLMEKPVE